MGSFIFLRGFNSLYYERINFKGDDFMFKEVRTTIFDVLAIYGCMTGLTYVAYQVGKIVGKAEVVDKKRKTKPIGKDYTKD